MVSAAKCGAHGIHENQIRLPEQSMRIVLPRIGRQPGGAVIRPLHALRAQAAKLLPGGCHTGRDTAGAIERAGLRLTEIERFTFPEGSRGPEAAAIIGRAVLA